MQGLGSNHTAFYHKIGDRIPPQHAINASLRPMEINGNQHWVFLNIIEDGPAHRAGVKAGDVLYSCDGKLAEPPHSPRFQLGGTHELQLGEIEGSGTRSVKVEVPNRAAKDRPPMIEPKSITYRVAARGIGMIRVTSFPGAVGLTFARALDSANAALVRESGSRLIIDLRGVYLCDSLKRGWRSG